MTFEVEMETVAADVVAIIAKRVQGRPRPNAWRLPSAAKALGLEVPATIRIVAYSSAATGLVSFALILWGLRIRDIPPQLG